MQLRRRDLALSPSDKFHDICACPAIVFAITCHSLSRATHFARERRNQAADWIVASMPVDVHPHNAQKWSDNAVLCDVSFII